MAQNGSNGQNISSISLSWMKCLIIQNTTDFFIHVKPNVIKSSSMVLLKNEVTKWAWQLKDTVQPVSTTNPEECRQTLAPWIPATYRTLLSGNVCDHHTSAPLTLLNHWDVFSLLCNIGKYSLQQFISKTSLTHLDVCCWSLRTVVSTRVAADQAVVGGMVMSKPVWNRCSCTLKGSLCW